MARVGSAIIDVDLADVAESSGRTGTDKAVDQIVASTAVLAWIGLAIVDVKFTILALETVGTLTRVGAY